MSKHPATEISRALQETELPSTEKVAEVLEKTKISIEEQGKQASYFSGERRLAKDAAEFVEATKEFIQEKNQGEVIQQLVKDTGMAAQELADTFQNYNFFLNRDQMISMRIQAKDYSRLAQERLNAMRTLAITLVNSQEFRQLMSDMAQLIQDTFRAEVQKAPSKEVDTSKPVEELTEEAKAKAMETTEFGKKVVSDIREGKLPVPEERKQAVQQRFKDILRKLSADSNYRSSVDGLISIMDQIQFHLSQIAEQTKEQIQEKGKFAYGTATNKLFSDLKIFTSQFTGEHALNLLYEDLNKLFQLTTNDQRINSWFWDMRHFLIEVLRNPDMLDTEEFNTRWNDLYNRGNEIYYDENFNKAWYSVSFDFQDCMNNIRNDTLTQRVATDASKLARELFLDTSGKPSLVVMQTGLTNLRNLVLPIIKKNLENVPVGPLQSSDETYDWIVENLYLNAREIIPDHIEIKVWGKADVSLAEQPSKAVSYITMWIRNFHLDARDIKFQFRRKGLLKLEEKGIADVNLTGRNIIRITWRVESDQKGGWIFGVEQVKCYLDDLDITIKESTHTFLMKLITSLFSGSIRSAVEDKVEKGIAESLVTINDKMNDALLGLGY